MRIPWFPQVWNVEWPQDETRGCGEDGDRVVVSA